MLEVSLRLLAHVIKLTISSLVVSGPDWMVAMLADAGSQDLPNPYRQALQ